jgi:hypothetical protein
VTRRIDSAREFDNALPPRRNLLRGFFRDAGFEPDVFEPISKKFGLVSEDVSGWRSPLSAATSRIGDEGHERIVDIG